MGYSTGYIRRASGSQDFINFSAAIIEVTSTAGSADELEVYAERIDDSTAGSVNRIPDRSGITIIKLDDDLNYARYVSSAAFTPSATDNARTTADLGTTVEQDSPFTRTGNSIDIATTNLVLAVYSLENDRGDTVSGRTEIQGVLDLAGTEVDGTWSHSYGPRQTDNTNWGGMSCVALLEPSSGDDLQLVVVSREDTDEDWFAALQLVELPSGTEAIIVEATTGDFNGGGVDFAWDTAPRIDTGAFTHTTGTADIEVDNDDDYLAMASLANDAGVGGGAMQRAVPAIQFRVNTTDDDSIGSSSFSRGSGSADHPALACATLLTDLSAGDVIRLRCDRLNASVTGTIANEMGGMAVIRLSSLFPSGGTTLEPTSGTVTVVANSPTIIPPEAPPSAITPVHRLQGQQAVRWGTFHPPRRWRPQAVVHTAVLFEALVSALVPVSASVSVTANDAVPVPGVVAVAPTTASVTALANDPGLSLGAVTLGPGTATVTVSAPAPAVAPGAVVLVPAVATATVVTEEPTLSLATFLAAPVATVTVAAPEPTASPGPATVVPGSATVTVTAPDPTLSLGGAILAAGAAIVGVSGQDPSTDASTPLTPSSAVVAVVGNDPALSAAGTLTPGVATVVVVASAATLATPPLSLIPPQATVNALALGPALGPGAPMDIPLRRLHGQQAVRWRYHILSGPSQVTRLPLDALILPEAALASPSAVVTVVAQAAGLSAGESPDVLPYLRLRKPGLAPRWASFLPVVQVAGGPLLREPGTDTGAVLSPGSGTVTVVANSPAITTPAVASVVMAVRVTPQSTVLHWAEYLDPFPQIAGVGTQTLLTGTVLQADAASVTVVANAPGIGATVSATAGSAVVTVTAQSPGISAGSAVTALPPSLTDLVPVRWTMWNREYRSQRRGVRVGLDVAVLQFLAVVDGALVTVDANDAAIPSGSAALAAGSAAVTVVAQSPAIGVATALVPAVAVVEVVATTPGLSASAVSLEATAAIVLVFAPDPTITGGDTVIPVQTGRRWWRRYYFFGGGGG